jgi:hypothetical protein
MGLYDAPPRFGQQSRAARADQRSSPPVFWEFGFLPKQKTSFLYPRADAFMATAADGQTEGCR